MKKASKKFFITAVAVMLAAWTFTSCSSSEKQDLDAQLASVASDNSAVVIAGDISRLFGELEVEVKEGRIELPDYLRKAINMSFSGDERSEIYSIIDNAEGVEWTSAVLASDAEATSAVLTFGISDADALEKSLKKAGCDADMVLTEGASGYVVFDSKDVRKGAEASAILEKLKKEAAEAPLSDWKKSRLTRENICNVMVSRTPLKGQKEGYIFAAINLEEQSLKISGEMSDLSGSPVKSEIIGDFDTSLMDYAGEKDIIGVSVAMNRTGYQSLNQAVKKYGNELAETARYRDDRLYILFRTVEGFTSAAAEYISERGMFLSAGISESKTLADFNPSSPETYHFVAAVSLEPDKSEEAFDMVCKTFEDITGLTFKVTKEGDKRSGSLRLKYNREYDYITDQWVDVYFDVNILLDGNVLVISNEDIRRTDKTVFNREIFAGSLCAAQIIVNQSTPVLSQFGYKTGVNVYGNIKESTAEAVVTMTDTQLKFAPALVGLITNFGN